MADSIICYSSYDFKSLGFERSKILDDGIIQITDIAPLHISFLSGGGLF